MITNPQAIKVAEHARAFANSLGSLFRTADQYMIEAAKFDTLTSGALDSDEIADSLQATLPMTKLKMAQFKYVIEQFLAMANTDDRRTVVSNIATHTAPMF